MSESILKALMQLFALITDIHEKDDLSSKERDIVESFLNRLINHELVVHYMKVFDEYLELHHMGETEKDSRKDRKRTTLNAMKIMGICQQINEELQQKQKVFVLLQLIEFIAYGEVITEKKLDFLQSVASAFNIDETEYLNCKSFIMAPIEDIPEKQRILLIDNYKSSKYQGIKHIYNEHLSGEIILLHISSTNTYAFRYLGEDNLYLNGQNILLNRTCIFDHGSTIRSSRINDVYYSDVAGKFLKESLKSKISIVAEDVVFKFKNSENGIQKFDFSEESGQLVGIIGGSGVGKSTLLNVLNGNLKPRSGKIFINGYDIYDDEEKKKLEGVIGFVPQDDLLMEELTVYQNLYYNAKLCFGNFPENKIEEIVEKALTDLDLYEIKDLTVGNPLKKFISGGQRKRLNIALELLREPSILFVDEPTSGLSSVDSEAVMDLLKEQVLKGKLLIVNIHQPSSDLYKMFDKVLFLDKGGYLIYYGNPSDAVVYFKTMSSHVHANEDQCVTCGNVNPEQILQIIEAKVVNEYGKLTYTRKTSPKKWFEFFQKNRKLKHEAKADKKKLPENYFSIPGLFKQFKIFFIRDILSKLTNKQYLLISFLEAPLLAFILGYFTKYIHGTIGNPNAYNFMENENLPAYLFMCVIVALFLGLTISAEEIIKDRKILQRESFLHLSRISYLNAKIIIMFALSAIQTISFILIGNLILEIKDMTLNYWLILFTTSCFANMLGLNISSAFNSVVTIYMVIIFILIPQLLLSGAIVKFDKLHKDIASLVYVPVIGDLMTSRWAYEALTVKQFKSNKFQKHFFDIDKEIKNANYNWSLLINGQLKPKLEFCERNLSNQNNSEKINNLKILRDEIAQLQMASNISFSYTDSLNIKSLNAHIIKETKDYLNDLEKHFRTKQLKAENNRDAKAEELIKTLAGKEKLLKLKQDYHNKRIEEMVTNSRGIYRITEAKGSLIRLTDPIYKDPESTIGRAHFYASIKRMFGKDFETMWFNITVIWFTTLVLYITLYYDLLRKLVTYFENIRIRRLSVICRKSKRTYC